MGIKDFFNNNKNENIDCDEDCLACPHLHVDCDGNDFYQDVIEYDELEDDY